MRNKFLIESALAFSLYALLTLVVNWPLWPKLSLATYGYTGDSYGFLWQLWWGKETNRELIDGKLTPLLGAPFGSPIDYYFSEPLLLGFGRLLASVTNHFVAFNLLILISFPLAGLTTYWLAKYLTKNSLAAFLAGLIFAFSPYHFWQSYAHISLAQIQWLPLFLLAWLVFLRQPKVRTFLFLLVSYLLVFFTSFIYGYFAAILSGLVLGVDYLFRRKNRGQPYSFQFKVLVVIFFIAVLGLGSYYHGLFLNPGTGQAPVTREGRDMAHALALSARPWDYFLPAPDHPWWGKCFDEIRTLTTSPLKPESILYFGFVPLLLAIFAIYRFWRKREIAREFFILIFLTLAFFWLSLPPSYSPSYLLFLIFPSYRVFSRFAVIVLLPVSLLSACGLQHLLENKGPKTRWLIAILVSLLVGGEFLNIPPFHYTDYSRLPCSVVWLRDQKDSAAAIDYPVGYDFGEVQIWQIFHRHPLFNGAFEWQKTVAVWQEIWDLTKIGVGQKLNNLGIKYVVVHTQDFLYGGWHPVAGSREGSFSQKLTLTGKEGLKLVKSCPEAEIYQINVQ